MYLPTIVTLTLSSLAVSTALPTTSSSPMSFTGKGQLRTLWSDGDHTDLGCITDAGLWTGNNTLCGTFTGTPTSNSNLRTFNLTSAAGPCRIWGSTFICEQWNGGYPSIYEFGIWPYPNSIPGVDCLRWSKYGMMGNPEGNPTGPEDSPREIRLLSYIEKPKWVWLTWESLEN
ncbi:hypothetical protein N657DRAFT_650938 [Parathielavia appendiculata]|uniref:RNase T2-like C-terminal domain-containing protein n=1 Tax=Parathielavia appendiculata TaxID=2587402 RepID=A0AAN6YYD6_9PEZI|nr:hypothetical protein N657DRAFT_650938 [Parathielavia appendiculata]